MPTYLVEVPITGKLIVEVEAANKGEAIEKALLADTSIDDVEEWNIHRVICEGNVLDCVLNEATAEEV